MHLQTVYKFGNAVLFIVTTDVSMDISACFRQGNIVLEIRHVLQQNESNRMG